MSSFGSLIILLQQKKELKMKTKIVGLVAATMLLASSLNAGQGFMAVGYASADVDGVTSSGVSLDIGAKFGETFKQQIGTKFIFIGENKDWTDGQGNLLDIYYSLGYEVLPSTILSAKVGMGAQSLGSYRTSSGTQSVMSIGLAYGAILRYDISHHFSANVSYTQSNLAFDSLSYDMNVIDASLSYNF